MEVSETLRTAWGAVEAADLPEKLQETAFREAIRILCPPAAVPPVPWSGSIVEGTSSSRGNTVDWADRSGENIAVVAETEFYGRVAAQTSVDSAKLERLIHLDAGVVKISVPGLKLGKNNAERARTVAQLLTITRGFGLEEPETSLEVIRAECERLRVYDQNNFSSHMRALAGYVLTGGGMTRRIRAKGPGIAAFPTLVDELLGVVS